MSLTHYEIIQVVEDHRKEIVRRPHATLPGVYENVSGCAGCEWTGPLRQLHEPDPGFAEHIAILITGDRYPPRYPHHRSGGGGGGGPSVPVYLGPGGGGGRGNAWH